MSQCGAERPSEAPAAPGIENGCEGVTVEQILAWADAHHAAHGVWPAVGPGAVSGAVAAAPRESWKAINQALALGLRGLPGDSSLAELLAEHRGVPLPDMGPKALAEKIWEWEQEQFPIKGPRKRLCRGPGQAVRLTIAEILAWADAHHEATGKWPRQTSGPVLDAPHEVTWGAINQALGQGHRGLPGGTTLPRLLNEHRGPETSRRYPPLTVDQIVAWADAYHAAHGRWPCKDRKPVEAAPGQTWSGIDQALRWGGRGLPGGTSLGRLLVEHRGPGASHQPPALTVEQILAWADAHHAATGNWPRRSDAVADVPGETWMKIELSLRQGHRGLPGGTSLARLLAQHRGVRNPSDPPRLAVDQILAWADAQHAATGRWPTPRSGPIAAAPDETWARIQAALYNGLRGLPGGVTLPQVLASRKPPRKPPLTPEMIRAWALGHQKATGFWPNRESGPIAGVPGECWENINKCLFRGRRGLPGGTTLAKFLGSRKKRIMPRESRDLTIERVLAWADTHHTAIGRWPTQYSGPILGVRGERWNEINNTLLSGRRGLPGGTSLAKLLAQYRNPDPQSVSPNPDVHSPCDD